MENRMIKLVLGAVGIGLLLVISAIAVFGQAQEAACPQDGVMAPLVNSQQIHSESCPAIPGEYWNAHEGTYRHLAGMYWHTFTITTCDAR